MAKKHIITLAYEMAKTKYGKKSFTFQQLWQDLIKKYKLDKEEQQTVAHVYTALLQDNRFIFIGNNLWKIKELLTYDEQKDFVNSSYDLDFNVADASDTDLKQIDIDEKEMFNDEEMYYDEETLEEMYNESKNKFDDISDVDGDEEEISDDTEQDQ